MKSLKAQIIPVLIVLVHLAACSQHNTAGQLLKPADFKVKLAEIPGAQLVDVRTPEEFNEGHLAGAKNINFHDANFGEKINKLDKAKPVFVYCQSGGRSGKCAVMLKENGFTQIYDLKGGFMEWQKEGNEVEQ